MLIIQQAQKEDKPDVFVLAWTMATSYTVERSAFDDSFERILGDPKMVLLVAKLDQEIIGYCLGSIHSTFYANGNVAWLEELYVKHEHQRSRVGHKLVSALERWAIDLEAKLMTLSTRRARGFYLAIGYEESATYYKKVLSAEKLREAGDKSEDT